MTSTNRLLGPAQRFFRRWTDSLRAARTRAIPHERRSRPHARVAALALCALAACDAHGPDDAVNAADARQSVDEVMRLFRPVDPTTTSDVQDQNFRDRAAALVRLQKAGHSTGVAALAALQQNPTEPPDVQWALLEIAAHNAPEETYPTLEKLILEYDGGKNAGLRTQAVRILSEALPERAIEVLEPMIRDPFARATRPPQEELVRGWATAARKLNLKEARVLCDLIVDLRQPPDARYAAVTALGDIGGERGVKALREVLAESASDGNIRRKSAQALLKVMPRKEFCALIDELAQHESDAVFINFLADVLDKNCGGQ